jgi:mRNA-degrading endonuclease toxin of MazEF toxin-antitoxin module
MKRGTFVLTPFPFSDLTTAKRRPAVIVSSTDENEVIVAFITSQSKKATRPTDLIVETSHPDFTTTGLKKDSAIRLRKLCTIEKSIIYGEIGEAPQNLMREINLKLRIALQLDETSGNGKAPAL